MSAPALAQVRQRGFTMVELLVAMAIGVLLLAGVVQIYISNAASSRVQDGSSKLQENARFALHMLSKDVRVGEFLGCVQRRVSSGDLSFNNPWGEGIQGWESMASVPTTWRDTDAGVNAAGDVLRLRVANSVGATIYRTSGGGIDIFNPPESTLNMSDAALMTDCEKIATFNAGSSNNATILARFNADRFAIGARIYPVNNVTYYLRDSEAGSGPALWRQVGAATPQEMVEGVEAFEVTYGIGSDSSSSRAERYVDASAIGASDWNNVVSVRIGLLIRSPEEVATEADTRTFNVNGTMIDPTDDRRLRQIFTTTVALRNRAS